MVKFNTTEDDLDGNTQLVGEVLGMLLCGIATSVVLGVLFLGIGLMLWNVVPAIGFGLSGSAIGLVAGLSGGAKTIRKLHKDNPNLYKD